MIEGSGYDVSPVVRDGELVGERWTPNLRARVLGEVLIWRGPARSWGRFLHERMRTGGPRERRRYLRWHRFIGRIVYGWPRDD